MQFVAQTRTRWFTLGLGLAASVVIAALPWPVSGNPDGYWCKSKSPLFTCEEAGEPDGTVCAEWLTGGEESLFQPCCIDPSALGSSNLGACDEPLQGKRPSEF